MKSIESIIKERALPDIFTFNSGRRVESVSDFLLRREEMKKLLCENEYGYIPKRPNHLDVAVESVDNSFCAGKAPLTRLVFTVTVGETRFSFPVNAVIPKSDKKCPAFVFPNFSSDVPDRYLPSEEIADRGYAVFSFCRNDITSNKGFKSDKLSKIFQRSKRKLSSPGKLVLWAWAAMRVMDYVMTLDSVDTKNIAIIGHSRLGCAALLAGAFDERFKYVISNCSGSSGAAITRGKEGERIADILTEHKDLFCPRYERYLAKENSLPFDQHFLLSLIAPRHLIIGSAKEDILADPKSEFLGAYLAGEAYERIYKTPGLVHENKFPEAKAVLDGGNVMYHIRHGLHCLSREDWGEYMNYIDAQRKNNK